MKNLSKIGILLAAIILSAHTVSLAGTGALHDTATIKQAQQERSSSTHPAHTAFLLSILNKPTMDIDLTSVIIGIVALSIFFIPIMYDQFKNKEEEE